MSSRASDERTRTAPSRLRAQAQTTDKCSCGGGCPRCGMANLAVRGELQSPGSTDPSASTEDVVADPTPLDTSACPVNAVFLSNVAGGNSKVNCQVPSGQHGAARLAQYRVNGLSAIPPGGVTISEQFSAVDDPYSIASKLKPNSMVTDSNGMFDDCYSLFSPEPLPPDFRLQVVQNHLYQGAIISKNMVTYSAGNNVDVRHCRRLPGSCDFSKRCGLA
jgi:hypothetical protein